MDLDVCIPGSQGLLNPGDKAARGGTCDLAEQRVCSATQSLLSLGDPVDCSPPCFSVHGISQARILEWGVWGSSPPRDRTQVSLSLCVPFSFTLSLLVLLFYFFIPFSHFFYFISPFSSSCFLLDLAFSIYFP